MAVPTPAGAMDKCVIKCSEFKDRQDYMIKLHDITNKFIITMRWRAFRFDNTKLNQSDDEDKNKFSNKKICSV